MSEPVDFTQALIAAYRENPCQVLPNALWKSISWAEEFETDFSVEGGQATYLLAEGPDRLMLHWSRSHTPLDLYPERMAFLKFALLHQEYITSIPEDFLPSREAYFRLIHHMEEPSTASLPAGYRFQNAFPRSEAHAISYLIGSCYETIHPSPRIVQSWIKHPVFDPALWLWVINESENEPVGLGIAEFDSTNNEGSLEWIQVLPEYQGQGLGSQIVFELLNRLEGRADFTTVSGRIDNDSYPEDLYRNCGFKGDDIWWVLRSQE
jgi:GNAT superfamily N-acetyltransferase